MSRVLNLVTSRENLTWAWRKALWLYQTADGPIDAAEIAAFELDLERELDDIARDFTNSSYEMEPLILLPQPKKPDEQGRPRLRQSFHISVRDQVAWLALINVIGPTLDSSMPYWSYGHRLYKAAWFEEKNGQSQLELGPYRHTSGHLYRRFKHSWPLFRRHISLCARFMAHGIESEVELDNAEKSALHHSDKPAYLHRDYWKPLKKEGGTLYYASIDLEKFYPKIQSSAIKEGFRRYLDDYNTDAWLKQIIDRMLDFKVGTKGSRLLDDPIVHPQTTAGAFEGVPTGLMVAGFLSNIAMLPLDIAVASKLQLNRRIAHFRFVDDHAILAYDFDELRQWIREYRDALKEFKIGPGISPTKYDPLEMFEAIELEADHEKVLKAKSLSKIDGRHAAKLMTKTLALVSELAGADFNILSEDSRNQRLHELEWLLLADVPNHEIRADTRAAFAAGKIASLVPVSNSPSWELLQTWRDLNHLKTLLDKKTAKETKAAKEEIELLRVRFNQQKSLDREKHTKRVKHFFKLIFQAFCDHPAKPRLFIRILDYCRITGHNGTDQVLLWIKEHLTDEHAPTAEYLRPLAIQIIARHIVTAISDTFNPNILMRQRMAAQYYLLSLSRQKTADLLFELSYAAPLSDVASRTANASLLVAIAYASHSMKRLPKNQRKKRFETQISDLKAYFAGPLLTASSNDWYKVTGAPIGVWTHWLDGMVHNKEITPGAVWKITASTHNPKKRLDWLSLRKGPSQIPRQHIKYITERKLPNLQVEDGGWLLEQLDSQNAVEVEKAKSAPIVQQIKKHSNEVVKHEDWITLSAWILESKKFSAHDPRASEWTALEVIRQLLEKVKSFPEGDIKDLDELHPSNILLPKNWLLPAYSARPFYKRWTWESWRSFVGSSPILITKNKIQDYRRHPHETPNDEHALWRARLRGCGLLLLGLIARDFRLPAYWNVNGLERDVASFVRKTLEEVPISSHSHAIIEAALLPRSIETALISLNPWAFFGIKDVDVINDTARDPKIIPDIEALLDAVKEAQAILQDCQSSVLDHAPRQLIPMNVIQLAGSAEKIVDMDADQ